MTRIAIKKLLIISNLTANCAEICDMFFHPMPVANEGAVID